MAVLQPTWATEDGSVRLFLGDCLDILPHVGPVDAVVTDPPYGINADKEASKNEGKWGWKFYGHTSWDTERPSQETFNAVLSVSKAAVIWGGNYFADLLPTSMGWLAWDKGQRDFSLADFELAWTSEWRAARFIHYPRAKALVEEKVHPTQKPVDVMRWCLDWLRLKQASPIIADPFMGSGTTGIACIRKGCRFIGIEREPAYFDIARRRIEAELNSAPLFEPAPKIIQREIFT